MPCRALVAWPARAICHSYDMLGEGARTAADADRYFADYAKANRGDRPGGRFRGAAGPALASR